MFWFTMAKYKEAEDHVERMIRREPGNLNYRVDLGLTYVKQGDLTKSRKIFTEPDQKQFRRAI